MYRHLQARLRSNAESVAFYGGIEKEGKIIVARFKELLRHHSRLLTKQWQFGMVQVSPASLLPRAPYPRPPAAPLCFSRLGQTCWFSCLIGCLFVMHKQVFPVQEQHPALTCLTPNMSSVFMMLSYGVILMRVVAVA